MPISKQLKHFNYLQQNYQILIVKYDAFRCKVSQVKCFHCYAIMFVLCECNYSIIACVSKMYMYFWIDC